MHLADLDAVAAALVAGGKGLLAADESPSTAGKRLASIGVPNSAEARRKLRSLLFTTPNLSRGISGVILNEETLTQAADDGRPFPELLLALGILPGVKLDTGTQPLPGALDGETWTAGLDSLATRAAAARAVGARFAKWRAVLRLDVLGCPSPQAVAEAAHSLARYAVTCQAAGLVPVMEPEVLAEGSHDLATCAAATAATLQALFAACALHGVRLQAALLKPNFVTPGLAAGAPAAPDAVAAQTLEVMRRCVPAGLPGIVFLSGGQGEAASTAILAALAQAPGPKPWALSFSFGRALQDTALKTWGGREEAVAAAQAVLRGRVAANLEATGGRYTGEAPPA